nr:hypothetical protein [Candidatus Baldrarchaeota archaeon]
MPIVKGDVIARYSSAVIIAARVLGYAVTVIFSGVSTVVWVSFRGPVTVRVAFSVLYISASCGWNVNVIFVFPGVIVWGVIWLFGRGGFRDIFAGSFIFGRVSNSIFIGFPAIVFSSIFGGMKRSFSLRVLEVRIVDVKS